MHESELEIKTGNREIAQKMIECGNLQKPFELCGVKYLVTGVSREIGASSVATSVTMRQLVKPEWRGPEDGLPPVGLEVEVLYNSSPESYVTCKILAHDNDRAVYRFTGGPRKGEYQSDRQWFDAVAKRAMFRHIPTAEEVAAKEREKGIKALCDLMEGFSISSAAESLYDSGVRAPEVE